MIVLTHVDRKTRYLRAGDEFHMTVLDGLNCEVVIREVITVNKEIDFVASYRFALEDGTCPGFHLCGVFANSKELPMELKNAVMFNDLTQEQQQKFASTVGTEIKREKEK